MSQTGGGRANRSGNTLENMVEGLLIGHGYAKLSAKEFASHALAKEPIFMAQVFVGKTIYETRMKVDFFVFHPSKYQDGLIIECKWQQSAGSVDEKYPYLVANLLASEKASVIVLDGGGYKPGAKLWLERQSLENERLATFDLAGFTRWANNGGL